jgi:exodeoxyribonuclease VII large subunit
VKNSPETPGSPAQTGIYSVSQLNRRARQLLESGLAELWVAGEISNLARPGSGHLYFSLKDADAQLRCAMFRSASRGLGFKLEDGMQVVAKGRVSIYEARGAYQLIVTQLEEAGAGLLQRKFEELKARLSAAGLFDESAKQPLPALPETIGIVTSPSGAAVRDILHVLARRYPAARVIIYPTRVQGDGAAAEIVGAIELAVSRHECDVLIIARGGGSLEDLWSFNEEQVAQAIYACPLPVVSGVGHEVDVTIADLVADVRAPTPSGAAELVTPDRIELLQGLQTLDRRLGRTMRRLCAADAQRHEQLVARLRRAHPGAGLRQLQQRADEFARRLATAMQAEILGRKTRHRELQHRIALASPAGAIATGINEVAALRLRLASAMNGLLQLNRTRFTVAVGQLDAVSPLATLERGYAIVQNADTGGVVRSSADLTRGDQITARLSKGSVDATVIKIGKY